MGSKGRKPSGGFPRMFPRGLLSMLRTATERDTVCQGCSTALLLPPVAQEATELLSAHKCHVWEVAPLVFAFSWAMVLHRTHSSLECLTNMKMGYETDWPGEPASCRRSSETTHPRLQTSEVLWDRALCPVHAIPCQLVLEQAGAQGGSSPGMETHTSGRHTWPTSRNFQAQRWDTAPIIPARSWLWAARKVPAWAADREASLSLLCVHSKSVWSGLCPRACRQGCARLLPSHCRFSSH